MPRPLDPLEGPELAPISAAARERWRADEEEWGRAAAEQWAHRRSIADFAGELARRGDRVVARGPGVTATGLVVGVGDDFVELTTPGGLIVLRSGAVTLEVATRARAGGRQPRGSSGTLRARLVSWEAERRPIELGVTALADEVRGHTLVGRDHVVVRRSDGGEIAVPLSAIAWARVVL